MRDDSGSVPRSVVLVVDDERDIRDVVRVCLEVAGYDVIEAGHGETALEQALASPPQLVITDRMMPRMSGDTLIERLRANERTAGIPILMLSATPGDQPDADAVLDKPFDPNELIAVVGRLTRSER
jgi:two-component system phosphate regulon response regulator PhoB